jgi:DNA polymerase-3 subunit gamma/tau
VLCRRPSGPRSGARWRETLAHLALARKWRPQRFEDVIGQRGVVDTLKNAITSDRLAQAFIFAGPRGVGKTTTARILARALNCVTGPTPAPCGKCDACVEIAEGRDFDVFEIDGATYTGVDDVRKVIIEPLGIAPLRDRFKVFIIDEVHRLSKQAFDALLKSIEEPPPYVKFMMATTDLHAVPATIQSRSQVFELRTLPFAAIRDQLAAVTTDEKVAIDDAALALIARSAEGSMRDALSALDQVLAFTTERVTARHVSIVLGVIGRDLQLEVLETVAREDVAAVFGLAGTIVESGFDLRIVCRELARLVRDVLVVRIDPTRLSDPEIAAEGERDRLKALATVFSREDLMRSFDLLGRAEFEIRGSSQPRHHFEMSLVKWIHLRKMTELTEIIEAARGSRPLGPAVQASKPSGLQASSPAPQASKPSGPQASSPAPQASKPSGPQASSPVPQASEPPSLQASKPSDLKAAFLSAIREANKTFFGIVVQQATEITIEGDSIVFSFSTAHTSSRMDLQRRRPWLEELARTASGRAMTVVVREVAAAPATAAPSASATRQRELRDKAKANPGVQAILEVFGGDVEDVEEIN